MGRSRDRSRSRRHGGRRRSSSSSEESRGRRPSPARKVRAGFDQKALMPQDFAAQQTLDRMSIESTLVRPPVLPLIECPEVDAFLAQNAIEPHAVARLRRLPVEHQLMVIQNSLKGARDPSAVLIGRMRNISRMGLTGAPVQGPGGTYVSPLTALGLTGVQQGGLVLTSAQQVQKSIGSSSANQDDQDPEDWQAMSFNEQGEITIGGAPVQSNNKSDPTSGGSSLSNPFASKPVTRKASPERDPPREDPVNAAMAAAQRAAQELQRKLAAKEAERDAEAAKNQAAKMQVAQQLAQQAQRQAQEAQQMRQAAQIEQQKPLSAATQPLQTSKTASADDTWEEPTAEDLAEWEAACEGLPGMAPKAKAAPKMAAFGSKDNLLQKLSEAPTIDPLQAMQQFFGRLVGANAEVSKNAEASSQPLKDVPGLFSGWSGSPLSIAGKMQDNWIKQPQPELASGYDADSARFMDAKSFSSTSVAVDDTAFSGSVFSGGGSKMSAVQLAIQEELERQQLSRANLQAKVEAIRSGTSSFEKFGGTGSSFSVNDFDLLAPHVKTETSTADDEANAKALAQAMKAARRQQNEFEQQQEEKQAEEAQKEEQKAYEDYWVQQQLLSQRQLFETQKVISNMVGVVPTEVTGSKIPMAPGDWACPSCNDHQFARNRACRRCGAARPVGAGNRLV